MATLKIAFEAPDIPASSTPSSRNPIDLAHLYRQTMGDTALEIEVTVEAVRHRAQATVVPTPFYNPPQKTQTPPA